MLNTAMILAAGLGKRMRPITNTIPKPLVPVGGVTLLDRILNTLAENSITQVIVNSHYKADLLEAHLHQRAGPPSITISHEDSVLETGGGILQALPLLGDGPFFIINGDVLWLDAFPPALSRLREAWDSERMDSLLLLHPTQKAIGYEGEGDFRLEDGQVIRPDTIKALPYVFTGISILHPRLFTNPPAPPFSLNALYWRARQKDGTLNRIYGLVHEGEWLHIGTPEGLAVAEGFLKENISK